MLPSACILLAKGRQLIEGLDEKDRALGFSGGIVKIADPQGLADAALALLGDLAAWQAASQAGISRVERYYNDDLMFSRYREVYARVLNTSGAYS